jgi:hypothetical protein
MRSTVAARNLEHSIPTPFFAVIGNGRKSLAVVRKKRIFTQGDPADAVFYI